MSLPVDAGAGTAPVGQLPLPTAEGAIVAGIVLLALLIALLAVTLGSSVYERRRDVRRERVRDDVEATLLSRMSESDPEWEQWAATLSAAETWVVKDLLDEYLQTITGSERATLVDLARELDVHTDAEATLSEGRRHERLQALRWLASLEESVSPALLRETCTGDSDLRAAAARVLYEADHPDAKTVGTDLLLGDGTLTLSVHGLDTLYRLHREDPSALLERGRRSADGWRTSLVVQVLSVVSECGLTAQDAPWDWVFECTSHDVPTVRAAAVSALQLPGWDPEFRDRADRTRLLSDPHRNVRRETYRLLAEWGDDESVELLAAGAARELDQRSRVVALQQLADIDELGPAVLAAGRERVADGDQFGTDTDTDTVDAEPTEPVAATVSTTDDTAAATAPQSTLSDVAADVAVDTGTTSSAEGAASSYDRAVQWVRGNREAVDR